MLLLLPLKVNTSGKLFEFSLKNVCVCVGEACMPTVLVCLHIYEIKGQRLMPSSSTLNVII